MNKVTPTTTMDPNLPLPIKFGAQVDQFPEILDQLRASFNMGLTRSIEFKKLQLKNLRRMFTECESEILNALHQDLRKSTLDGKLGDMKMVQAEIDSMLRHLKEYGADEKLPLNILTLTDKGYIRKEPFGVVLVLGTWNYPFQSTLQPVVGAIAAGNCVVIKPSEVTPTCAETMAKLIPKYLDQRCYQVVTGDAEMAKEILKNKFDYIFCIGSTEVGRSVLQSAAAHLTPVTLELGGKNPVYIHDSADIKRAAKRILWGKFINTGQLCVCPDYVMCSEKTKDEFIRIAPDILKDFFGDDSQASSDIPRIVNKRHFNSLSREVLLSDIKNVHTMFTNRIKQLLEKTEGKIVVGGRTCEDDLWIEPTIIVDVNPGNDALIQEEIFGPILPIISPCSVPEAISIISSKPKPLALYIFSTNETVTRQVLESTSSGNVCINNVVWQSNWIGLPFGGVGASGMGNFHGKYSFETFSHKRSVLERPLNHLSEKICELSYPPCTQKKQDLLFWLIDNFDKFTVPCGGLFSHTVATLLGAFLLYILILIIN